MERPIDALLSEYSESHLNPTNKLIHWVCVPTIMFSLLGMLYALPFPFAAKGIWSNWAAVLLAFALVYYLRLSLPLFIGFVCIGGAMLWGNALLYGALGQSPSAMAQWCLGIFALAWVGQFIGHKIEGKKPSFFKDVQFLLIGPAWLLHFIFKKTGIKY
jgi:uncharacterized membrane protein YGL010W